MRSKSLKTYYVGCRWLWPIKRTTGPEAVLATSARKACKGVIQRLNAKLENPLRQPLRYRATRREDALGHSIHQVRLRLVGSDRDALVVAAAMAEGVPEVSQ